MRQVRRLINKNNYTDVSKMYYTIELVIFMFLQCSCFVQIYCTNFNVPLRKMSKRALTRYNMFVKLSSVQTLVQSCCFLGKYIPKEIYNPFQRRTMDGQRRLDYVCLIRDKRGKNRGVGAIYLNETRALQKHENDGLYCEIHLQ